VGGGLRRRRSDVEGGSMAKVNVGRLLMAVVVLGLVDVLGLTIAGDVSLQGRFWAIP
jgi:hypothetical protein